ncbi:dTDP-4-dehydrorhamnose reductase [Ramlibacter sp. MMS24-I3-19]|uniref:dTDP-4-dehydrorhamnose reductase n=1 Tax=Ramlibacter sp. MMS24-I3-19 TaxID=3416606 RepID=UPI003CFEA437
MKILLFGMGGQVGWELQRSLVLLGDVVALGSSGAEGLAGDFRQPEAVAATVRTVRPDVIVNAAAYTAVDKAEGDRDTALLVNAASPGAIAREAAACGALLVHYSTDYVFDGSGSKAWTETDPTGPLSVYGATKLEGEQQIQRNTGRHIILRTSWVYGARGGNFAKTMMRLAKQRERLTVVADQIGAPTGADLLADLTAHLVRAESGNAALRGTYHAAASGQVSWQDYAKFVLQRAQAAGVALKAGPDAVDPVSTSNYPTPARRPLNSRLDTTKLRQATGLVLPTWQSGVARMLAEVITEEPART